jgi:hypothetical protein
MDTAVAGDKDACLASALYFPSLLCPIPLAGGTSARLSSIRQPTTSRIRFQVESLLRRCSVSPLKCDAHASSGIHRLPSIYAYAVDTICGVRRARMDARIMQQQQQQQPARDQVGGVRERESIGRLVVRQRCDPEGNNAAGIPPPLVVKTEAGFCGMLRPVLRY